MARNFVVFALSRFTGVQFMRGFIPLKKKGTRSVRRIFHKHLLFAVEKK